MSKWGKKRTLREGEIEITVVPSLDVELWKRLRRSTRIEGLRPIDVNPQRGAMRAAFEKIEAEWTNRPYGEWLDALRKDQGQSAPKEGQ